LDGSPGAMPAGATYEGILDFEKNLIDMV
jgi:hypothetical protein